MHTFELCHAYPERFACFVARAQRTLTLIPALQQQSTGRVHSQPEQDEYTR